MASRPSTIYLDVSVPPGRRKALPIETGRHAFAYVFAGAGKFCNASAPLAVPTESVGWWDKTPPLQADNQIVHTENSVGLCYQLLKHSM